MNSKYPNFDWHARGVWIMHDPDGRPIWETADQTPYSCRATAVSHENMRWSHMEAEGYIVQGYTPAMPPEIRAAEQVTTDEMRWRYPATGKPIDQPPSKGDLRLLTVGRTDVPGTWTDDGRFIAWAPKIRRDKELEMQLGYMTQEDLSGLLKTYEPQSTTAGILPSGDTSPPSTSENSPPIPQPSLT